MNMKTRVAALAVAAVLSGTAQAALYDRGGGLIYDSALNVTWLQDANYAKTSGYDADGAMSWSTATTWSANLSYYDSMRNVTYTDWRLPTVSPVNGSAFNYAYSKVGATDFGYNISASGTMYAGSTASEMAHLYYELGNPAYFTPAGAPTGCYVSSADTCLNNVGPFTNFQATSYWSGMEYAPNTNQAWRFNVEAGSQDYQWKFSNHYALAVRPGDIANLHSLISGPYTITQGQNLLLNGAGSYGTNSIAQYAWDLNGDATFDVFGASPDLDATTLTGLGLGAGTHTIALRVTDTRGTFADTTTTLSITAVPEPGTYAMMLAGLGLVGFMARRRRV